jgi:hypothetical protein
VGSVLTPAPLTPAQRQLERLTQACDKVRDKKVADLTTYEHELLRACSEWDVAKIEELAPHLRNGW